MGKKPTLTRFFAAEADLDLGGYPWGPLASGSKKPRKDARGFPVVDPPKEKTDEKEGERTDQAPLRRLG